MSERRFEKIPVAFPSNYSSPPLGTLIESLKELMSLLVDAETLEGFGWPERPVDELLEAVIRRCGHSPASHQLFSPADRLRSGHHVSFF